VLFFKRNSKAPVVFFAWPTRGAPLEKASFSSGYSENVDFLCYHCVARGDSRAFFPRISSYQWKFNRGVVFQRRTCCWARWATWNWRTSASPVNWRIPPANGTRSLALHFGWLPRSSSSPLMIQRSVFRCFGMTLRRGLRVLVEIITVHPVEGATDAGPYVGFALGGGFT